MIIAKEWRQDKDIERYIGKYRCRRKMKYTHSNSNQTN